ITSRSWFDGAGRVLRAGTAAGASPTSYDAVKTEYDAMGRVSRQSNPYLGDVNGNGSPAFWTSNTYDSQSRVTTVTLPDTQTIQTEYNGAIVTVTDQVTRKRQSQVDGLGRLISVTEQDPATGVLSLATTYSYDTLDNLTGVDQGGQTRSFAYDSLGRMTSQSTPEGGAMSFAYTDFDAVLKRTDARNVETHYHYDALNRPNQVWYTGVGGSDDPTASRPALPAGVAATSDVIIAYNTAAPGNGSVNRIDDGGGFETYVYDSLGRNTSKTRTIDGVNSYQTQYQYNQTNQLAVMIYPSGKRVRMNFDSRGRMIGEDKVDTTGSLLTSYVSGIGYNVAGQVTSMTSGSGVTESYTYSANRLQLTRQTAVKGAATLMDLNYNYAAAAGASGAGTTAGNSGQLMAIGNNPSSQPSTINGQNRTQSFSYDDLGRLVSASSWGISQRSYSYDRWGNRTGMTDSIMGASQSISLQPQAGAPTGVTSNRIASVTNNGVMSSYVYDAAGNLTNDGAHSYQYDAENRIAKVDAGTSNEAGYCYDANNWRVKKVAGGFTTYYVWEGALVIAEYSNAPVGSGGTSYYVPDPLSTRMITDSSGALKGTQDHLPFGEDGGTTGTSERHRFTNYERDSESATDYAVNRQYAAGISRFMQLDPIEGSIDYPQSLNKFGYALNDPVNYTDPLGLKCAWVWVPWKVCSVFDGKEHCRSGGDWENICSNDFEIRITGGCDRPSPDRDISAVGGMLNIASTAATVGQYSNVNPRTGAWKGFTKQGPKWFRSGFPGNQYVSRSAALSYAKGFNVLGRAAGLLGAGLSFYQMSNAFSQGRNAEGRKFALDGGMGLVGTLGGPYGAAAATVYFGVDMTVGWPYVGHQLMLTRCGADCQYRLNHCTFANK
ncbi:MAG TPA: RHS repeat-associated core domain-containing protein, partial [Blastocatellia bacterium]|nr:RHS repeat-associated core domain-containing protein [Blastocatellia bacterium]